MKRLLACLGLVALSACGSPTSDSTPADVSGTWAFTETSTGVTGGECVGATLQAVALGTRSVATLSITQNGTALTGTSAVIGSTRSCAFAGTATASTFALNSTSCTTTIAPGFQCSNGAVRDLQLVSDEFSANVSGNTATGTETVTWTVLVAGTTASVGTLALTSSISGSH